MSRSTSTSTSLRSPARRAYGLGALGLGASSLIAPLLFGQSAAANEDPRLGDIVLGEADAPVTVIEYASLTCPHCARFHVSVWPEFSKNYIETGKVRFIMREVYFDRFGLWASMVARCGGHGGFYPIIDQFLKKQREWAGVPENEIADEIRKIGRVNGLGPQALDDCLGDQVYARALYDASRDHVAEDGVESTPTFFINGDRASGAMDYAAFSALLDEHL